MKNKENKEEIFLQGSIWKSILQMSFPAMISVLVMLLYNMADMYFVGMTGNLTMTASVSLAMPVFTILMGISTMLGNGGSVMIARALGKGDKPRMRQCFSICIWASLTIGVVVAALVLVLHNPLLSLLGANEEMWGHARGYVVIIGVGAPVVLLNATLCSLFRGEGAIKAGVIGNVLSTITNVVLDPLFIIGFGMGVGGAAFATVLSNAVGIVYYFIYKRKNETCMSFRLEGKKGSVVLLGSMLVLGLPNAVSSALSGLATTFSNRILVDYGTGPVASMGAANKTVMIISLIQMAVCMGVQPLLSYNYGARKINRLREAAVKLALFTLILGTIMGSVCLLARNGIVGLFIKDQEAAVLGAHLVTCMIWSMPFLGIYYVCMNFLQAAGRALAANILSILRQGILLIPLLHLLDYFFPLDGVAYAHMAADGLAVVTGACMVLAVYRRLVRDKTESVLDTGEKGRRNREDGLDAKIF